MTTKRTPADLAEHTNDPLTWLKREVQLIPDSEGFSEELVRELENFAKEVTGNAALRTVVRDPQAVEALVEILPSASLTGEFMESVERRRQAVSRSLAERSIERSRGSSPPGAVLADMRLSRGIGLKGAASALRTSQATLQQIESGSLPWHQVPVEQLPRLAQLYQLSYHEILTSLRLAVRSFLLGKIGDRMTSLRLGRFDAMQSASAARFEQLKTAFAMTKEENREAAEFFRRAEAVSKNERNHRCSAWHD